MVLLAAMDLHSIIFFIFFRTCAELQGNAENDTVLDYLPRLARHGSRDSLVEGGRNLRVFKAHASTPTHTLCRHAIDATHAQLVRVVQRHTPLGMVLRFGPRCGTFWALHCT